MSPALPDFIMTFKLRYINSTTDDEIQDHESADRDCLSIEGKVFRPLLREACYMNKNDGDLERFESYITEMDAGPIIRAHILEKQKKGSI